MRFLEICLAVAAFTTFVFADDQFISLPFVAVDRKGVHMSAWDQRLDESGVNVPLQNMDLAYLMNISIGTPPQPFTLLLDTGSSTTWVPMRGCGRYCGYPAHTLDPLKSSTFSSSSLVFSIRYGEGFSRGFYAEDTVTLNDAISVPHTNFAVSNINDGELTRDGADGILGIGPDPLSRFNNPDNTIVPTLVTNMFEQGVISNNSFSIYFQPINDTSLESRINGNIIFGGVDLDKVVNKQVTYFPSTSHPDYKDYWAADMDSVIVGDETVNFDSALPALVDTGSTLIFVPKQVVDLALSNVPDLRADYMGQYLVPCDSKDLKPITFNIAGTPLELYPEEYIVPHSIAGGTVDGRPYCYTYLHESPPYIDIILGYGFLQQYVSVYDNQNNRVGLGRRVD
ncbi:hypothetical protein LRAMOSA05919 [Lichtheimia ramosa]|uniref:Peptidase A1 domain-containing protein n=1 Tax=Lichtheimia ramosa TaxID=688394 RepID=A0A077X2D8_9FUNG|nr:hypothetical protein LRAMOSA05919 [Lichtheimia ramosa]